MSLAAGLVATLAAGWYFLISRLENALLVVLTIALLVPREFNIRAGGFSVSPSDMVFIAFLYSWFLRTLAIRKAGVIRDGFNLLIVLVLLFVALMGLLDFFFKGIQVYHFFLKDIYTFGTLSIVLPIFNWINITESNLRKVVVLLFVMSILLASFGILVQCEPVGDWYTAEYPRLVGEAEQMGYFIPGGEGATPFIAGQIVRPVRLVGGIGHIGWLALVTVPLTLSCFELLRKSMGMTILLLWVIVLLFSLLVLMSRSVFGGIFLSLTLLLLFTKKKAKIFSMLMVLVASLAWTGLGQALVSRFGMTASDVRWIVFADAWQQIRNDPLLGIGMGNTFAVDIPFRGVAYMDGVDCLYLTLGLKLGPIGGVIFVGLLGWFLCTGYRYLKKGRYAEASWEYRFVLGVFVALCGILFAGFFAYPFHSPSFALVFWALLGMYAKLLRLECQKRRR